MKDLKDRIVVVLEELGIDKIDYTEPPMKAMYKSYTKEEVAEALLPLFEIKLPEEKTERLNIDNSFDAGDNQVPIELEAFEEGFNQCLADIKELNKGRT